MNHHESFLDQDTAELERFLVQHARRDRAPRAAHERALVSLASVSLATGLTASAKLAWGASAASQVTPWLVGKWIAVGMSASLLTFGVAEGLHEAFSASEPSAQERKQGSEPAARRGSSLPEGVVQSPSEAPAPALSSHPAALPARPIQTNVPQPDSAQVDDASPFGSPAGAAVSEQLSREVTRLRHARALLVGGSAANALEVLDGYAREFPLGTLRVEAAALRIEAVAALGDRVSARRLATEFLTRFPSSPLAARVRQVSGLVAEEHKP
jgi:hypothetical protein